jgi:hypothetical protein
VHVVAVENQVQAQALNEEQPQRQHAVEPHRARQHGIEGGKRGGGQRCGAVVEVAVGHGPAVHPLAHQQRPELGRRQGQAGPEQRQAQGQH